MIRVLVSTLVSPLARGLYLFRRHGLDPIPAFLGSSPAGAAATMRELADLGDVDFDERDFDPRWFHPNEGIEAVDGLLGQVI